jgi:hypothetical protein
MTIRDKETLKGYFNRGDVPTEENFADLIDSFFNAAELVLHASSHMYGGSDPIATFTPGAYLIPMATADGKLDSTWFPQFKHGSLLNLGSDDHTQYVHISQSRTITAQHKFNPSTVKAPFTLGPNAIGKLVTGLRADELNKSVIAGDGLRGGNLLTVDAELSVDQSFSFNWTNQHIFNYPIMSSGIYPIQPDTYDIGDSLHLWRKGYFSELESLIFAKNTISIVGGWMMIAKGEGYFSKEVLPTDTYIDFGQTMTINDFVIVRYGGKVEYIKVGTQVNGYIYNVTRDLDGSSAETWAVGVPYVILGNTGNGRIELNATDTPRMSIIQQGSTYNSQTELIRIGDLNGGWGYLSETYGAAFGNYSGSGANITIDPTNGVRLRRGNTDVIKLTSTEATFKSLIKMPDTTSALAIGATPPTSSSTGTGLWIDRTGFYSLKTDVKQVWIDATNGALTAGNGTVALDKDGINLTSGQGTASSIKWFDDIWLPELTKINTAQINSYISTIDPNWLNGNLLLEAYGEAPGGASYLDKAWGIITSKVSNPVYGNYVSLQLDKDGLRLLNGPEGGVSNFYINKTVWGGGNIYASNGGLFGSGSESPTNGEVIHVTDSLRNQTNLPNSASGFLRSASINGIPTYINSYSTTRFSPVTIPQLLMNDFSQRVSFSIYGMATRDASIGAIYPDISGNDHYFKTTWTNGYYNGVEYNTKASLILYTKMLGTSDYLYSKDDASIFIANNLFSYTTAWKQEATAVRYCLGTNGATTPNFRMTVETDNKVQVTFYTSTGQTLTFKSSNTVVTNGNNIASFYFDWTNSSTHNICINLNGVSTKYTSTAPTGALRTAAGVFRIYNDGSFTPTSATYSHIFSVIHGGDATWLWESIRLAYQLLK